MEQYSESDYRAKHEGMENSQAIFKYHIGQIDRNRRPQILKEISRIQFPNLTTLVLFGNNIESLEGFSEVYMPVIACVNLCISRIIKMKITSGH
jgi:hypothetical protein